MNDRAYRHLCYRANEIRHRYGRQVHVLGDPVILARILRLSLPETQSIHGSLLLKSIYRDLVRVTMAAEFPRCRTAAASRMIRVEPDAIWSGEVIDPDTTVVSVAVARAGLITSQVCYEEIGQVIHPQNVRQDFLTIERKTGKGGRVLGARVTGAKVGGSYAGRIVLLPDPMGATGGSLDLAIRFLRAQKGGTEIAKIIVLNLVITPEFVRRMRQLHPQAQVYAARLDRGRSAPEVLRTVPGTHPEREFGLNKKGYIVPGLGGLGEYLNNAEY
jgi:uracil phosphoribosyltransferase